MTRSFTSTLVPTWLSPGKRLKAAVSNAIFNPSCENTGRRESLPAWFPAASAETRVTAPVAKSLTKISRNPLVSPGTRLSALLTNATFDPSGENTGAKDGPCAPAPVAVVETRVTDPLLRSLMKTS